MCHVTENVTVYVDRFAGNGFFTGTRTKAGGGRWLLYPQPKVIRKSSSLHIRAEFRLGSHISLFRYIL